MVGMPLVIMLSWPCCISPTPVKRGAQVGYAGRFQCAAGYCEEVEGDETVTKAYLCGCHLHSRCAVTLAEDVLETGGVAHGSPGLPRATLTCPRRP